jgi:hypothetical protein
MTTSGTNTFNPNRSEVVRDALEMCGHDTYEAIDAAVAESAHRTLNMMLKSLNANKTDVNVLVRTTFDTIAGDEDYETDALGIDGMTIAVNCNDYAVTPMTEPQYNAKVNKQSSGRPEQFYHDKQSGMVYLYPSPDAVYTVTYGKIRQYEDMTDDEQTFDLPSSAIKMLTLGLAFYLSFKQGFSVSAEKQDRIGREFQIAERHYLVANSKYTKGQTSTSCMVV